MSAAPTAIPSAPTSIPWLGLLAVLMGTFISTLNGRLSNFGLADIRGAVGRPAVDPDAETLNRRLKANHWRPGETLHFEKVHGATHDEASWARRVRPMLKFLFPAQ